MSLVDAKPGYTWGVYTLSEGGGGVGLTDGLAPADDDWPPYKRRREAKFPFALAQRALAIELQSAQASVGSDKTHILNAMIGETDDFNAPLPERHERYDLLNETLRARFAAGSLRAALERDEAALFFDALAKGRMHVLSLDFKGCARFAGGAVDRLGECLPATLQKLTVRSEAGDHLARVLAPWLRVNTVLTALDLSNNDLGDEGAKAIGAALHVNSVLTQLDLSDNQLCGFDWRSGRGSYTAEGIDAIADALRVNGVLTSLNLTLNWIGDAGKAALREIAKDRPSLTLKL